MFDVFYKYGNITEEPSDELKNQYEENIGVFTDNPFRKNTGYFWLEVYKEFHQWTLELYKISDNKYGLVDTESVGLFAVGTLKELDDYGHLACLQNFIDSCSLETDEQKEEFIKLVDKYCKAYKNRPIDFLDAMIDGKLQNEIEEWVLRSEKL